jgi:hypothetical protein
VFPHRRGREGYDKYRHDFSKLIWQIASPKWDFDDATFDRSAASFDNPDHRAQRASLSSNRSRTTLLSKPASYPAA